MACICVSIFCIMIFHASFVWIQRVFILYVGCCPFHKSQCDDTTDDHQYVYRRHRHIVIRITQSVCTTTPVTTLCQSTKSDAICIECCIELLLFVCISILFIFNVFIDLPFYIFVWVILSDLYKCALILNYIFVFPGLNILGSVTDNCPCWIRGNEKMAV